MKIQERRGKNVILPLIVIQEGRNVNLTVFQMKAIAYFAPKHLVNYISVQQWN